MEPEFRQPAVAYHDFLQQVCLFKFLTAVLNELRGIVRT